MKKKYAIVYNYVDFRRYLEDYQQNRQSEDKKFTLYKAKFEIGTGTVTLTNDNIGDEIKLINKKSQIDWDINQDSNYNQDISSNNNVFHKKFGNGLSPSSPNMHLALSQKE